MGKKINFEAAHKRELATAENSSAVCNAAKLRVMMDVILGIVSNMSAKIRSGESVDVLNNTTKIEFYAQEALAAPPRNCDVGTAEEQYNRHDRYCNSQPTCRKCLREYAASTCISCFAKWAQMPYESEVKK